MPTTNSQVKMKFGTQTSFDNAAKDSNTLYVTTDTNRFYVGSSMITKEAYWSTASAPTADIGSPGSVYFYTYQGCIYIYVKGTSGWTLAAESNIFLGYTPADIDGDTFNGVVVFEQGIQIQSSTSSEQAAVTYNHATKTLVVSTATDMTINGVKVSKEGHTHTKLDTAISKGSATKPIYVQNGEVKEASYELNKTVPSNAVFTDTVYTHPTSSGNKHIPSGGSSGQVLQWSADGTAKWETPTTVSVDSALSETSANPVQNKVVSAGLAEKSGVIIKTWTEDDVPPIE